MADADIHDLPSSKISMLLGFRRPQKEVNFFMNPDLGASCSPLGAAHPNRTAELASMAPKCAFRYDAQDSISDGWPILNFAFLAKFRAGILEAVQNQQTGERGEIKSEWTTQSKERQEGFG